jgi:hypothetical protein
MQLGQRIEALQAARGGEQETAPTPARISPSTIDAAVS